ncbi:hypothetical protein VFPBJ_08530 [Purpureocillium lilacinum]|uniref:Uncharacterized protein n=1 Tax=Purpureocillium lilacinum TaxID=33203 RepID=A0A179GFD8_PURLI|nr:hypothetical protein VFPBJ_08530 [Purpureocillium lilacinum]
MPEHHHHPRPSTRHPCRANPAHARLRTTKMGWIRCYWIAVMPRSKQFTPYSHPRRRVERRGACQRAS